MAVITVRKYVGQAGYTVWATQYFPEHSASLSNVGLLLSTAGYRHVKTVELLDTQGVLFTKGLETTGFILAPGDWLTLDVPQGGRESVRNDLDSWSNERFRKTFVLLEEL